MVLSDIDFLTASVGAAISLACQGAYKLVLGLWFEHALKYKTLKVEVLQYGVTKVGTQWWEHDKDMRIKVTDNGVVHTYRAARKGHGFNGASIPKLFSKVLRPEDNLINSAPHDPGYQFHAIEEDINGKYVWVAKGKREFDALFFSMSEQNNGNTHSVASVMFSALHIGGHKAWRATKCLDGCGGCPRLRGCVYSDRG
jgi:hypothetical protein